MVSGSEPKPADNAVRLAKTPRLDRLYADYPHTLIGTSGPDVGLPPGQMGNSEVGHLNFGAGRIAMMDISRIDVAVADGTLGKNPVLARRHRSPRKERGGRLHLLGLVSERRRAQLARAPLRARSTRPRRAACPSSSTRSSTAATRRPQSGEGFVSVLVEHLRGKGEIGVVTRSLLGDGSRQALGSRRAGVARDRARRRAARAPRALGAIARVVRGRQEATSSSSRSSSAATRGVDVGKDAAIFFNFRPDRAREITQALTDPAFADFARPDGKAHALRGVRRA